MNCEHDMDAVEIITRSDRHQELELEGECPNCGEILYACVELEVA